MSVTNKSSAILTTANMLMVAAKASLNPQDACDQVNILVNKLQNTYASEVAAALAVTIPGSKANFAAVYATLTQIVDGAVFTVSSTVDSTDTSLATAKGSAPAAGDTFQRAGTAPVFVGNAAGVTAVAAALAYLT